MKHQLHILAIFLLAPLAALHANDADPESVFLNPPESAKPRERVSPAFYRFRQFF